MKRYFMLTLICFVCVAYTIAQESKFVGTWKGAYKSWFDAFNERIIVIDISAIDTVYSVKLKTYSPKDTLDCRYINCYEAKQIGNTLQWYQKADYSIDKQDIAYKTFGAVFCESKVYAKVEQIGGSLHWTYGYWNKRKMYNDNGEVVNIVNDEIRDPRFKTETILYKNNYKW